MHFEYVIEVENFTKFYQDRMCHMATNFRKRSCEATSLLP
jgi:hypothetical protein